MSQSIIRFILRRTGSRYAVAALLSVLPVTEIKASILFAGASGANLLLAALIAYLSSLLLCLLLVFLFPLVTGKLKGDHKVGRGLRFLSERARKKAEVVRAHAQSENKEEKMRFAVFCFVAIPLPLTGVWTGALLGAFLGLKRRDLFLMTALGNFVAGCVVLAIALLAGEKAGLVLDVFIAAAILLLVLGAIGSRSGSKSKEKKKA